MTDNFIDFILHKIHAYPTESNSFPAKALKEALANCVAHAAYFENDGDIIIELFKNKIIISNLCLTESTYFANKWFSRGHKTINSVLMEVLRLSGHVDELGRGKNLILAESLKSGKLPPEVIVEKAGRLNRWKLTIYGGSTNAIHVKLLERNRDFYKNEIQALLATSLVLWHNKSVNEIKTYIEGDYCRFLSQIFEKIGGPVYYKEDEDKIYLSRWVRVLLYEGKDSKELTIFEDKALRKGLRALFVKNYDGYMTSQEFRQFATMGSSRSEISQATRILKKWVKDGELDKIGKGKYRFK